MNHQITLMDLGFIPYSEKEQEQEEHQKQYAVPCGGCICNHCANSVECWDVRTGEMEFPCFTCDECCYYDGNGRSKKRAECGDYKVTDKHAEYLRKRVRMVTKKKESVENAD